MSAPTVNYHQGREIVRRFTMLGKNIAVGTTLVDLIGFNSGVIIYPSSAALAVISDNVNNTIAGTGIQKIQVLYLDSNNDEQLSDEIDMNGITQVTVTKDSVAVTGATAINDFFATQVGSNLTALGNVTVINTANTETYRNIPENSNRSLDGFYTVPANRIAWYKEGTFGVTTIVGGQDATITVRSDTQSFDRTTLNSKVFTYDGHMTRREGTEAFDMGVWLENPAGSVMKFSGVLDSGSAVEIQGNIGVYLTL